MQTTKLPFADSAALNAFFALEQQRVQAITVFLDDIQRIDAEIDERVLDLYGITDAADRQRILGSAPVEEEEANVVDVDDDL